MRHGPYGVLDFRVAIDSFPCVKVVVSVGCFACPSFSGICERDTIQHGSEAFVYDSVAVESKSLGCRSANNLSSFRMAGAGQQARVGEERDEDDRREDDVDRRGENLGHKDNDLESSVGDMVTVPKSILQKILKNTEENKRKARESDIRARVGSIKQAAPRRAVSHLMKTLHLIEDAEEVWDELTETASRNEIDIIRQDNAEKANEALQKQGELLMKVKNHVKEEIGNQTIGATSVYGFKMVGFKEKDPIYEKDLLGVDENDVRSLEKAFVQRERKLMM